MTTARDHLKQEVQALVAEAERIRLLESARHTLHEDPETRVSRSVRRAVDEFSLVESYQDWYSRALSLVDQLLPDRLTEFVEAYKPARPPRSLDVVSYGISHYLSGIFISKYNGELAFDTFGVFITRLDLQRAIVRSAQARLDSLLADIRGTLEAELFDDELTAAEALRKKKHLRAAGVMAGVVLERHLKRVCVNHGIVVRKKNPGIADLNDLLKDEVYDTPRWREIQLYADIRNYAGHDKDRDPTDDEIADLIRGAERIVKMVF